MSWRTWWAPLAVATVSAVAILILRGGLEAVVEIVQPRPDPVLPEIARPHLAKAAKESERIIESHVTSFNAFFSQAKQNTPQFVDASLSWSSKWRLIADYIPGTDKNRHSKFLREEFQRCFFSDKQLEQAVRQVVTNYLADMRGIESKMLVDLRADSADLPYQLGPLNEKQMLASFDKVIASAAGGASKDLQFDVGRELAGQIIGQVLTQAALNLGVSSGVLGAGASSGTVTLGAGIVVGLILDEIITRFWDWYANPRGELADKINQNLDEMRDALVSGKNGQGGLRQSLKNLAKQRATSRERAVAFLMERGG